MADEYGAMRLRNALSSIRAELETLYSRDEIVAVSIAISLRSGNVRICLPQPAPKLTSEDGFDWGALAELRKRPSSY